MKRRDLLRRSTAFGLLAAVPGWGSRELLASSGASESTPLNPPPQGSIPVAFVVSEGAVIIDFCGPWEVFQDVGVPGRDGDAFHLYTVAETTAPIHASGGMQIVPDHAFATAPAPKVVVIPAQSGNDAAVEWIRKSARTADVVMSVCTGAFLLAKTGMLSGKAATTHHASYGGLATAPKSVHLGKTYYFCSAGHKDQFDAAPGTFLKAIAGH